MLIINAIYHNSESIIKLYGDGFSAGKTMQSFNFLLELTVKANHIGGKRSKVSFEEFRGTLTFKIIGWQVLYHDLSDCDIVMPFC